MIRGSHSQTFNRERKRMRTVGKKSGRRYRKGPRPSEDQRVNPLSDKASVKRRDVIRGSMFNEWTTGSKITFT